MLGELLAIEVLAVFLFNSRAGGTKNAFEKERVEREKRNRVDMVDDVCVSFALFASFFDVVLSEENLWNPIFEFWLERRIRTK
jgi:hypothetical protein